MLWLRARAVAAIVGAVCFTGAWMVNSLRQTGHGVFEIQLSGLAAPDARDPWLMIGGFVAAGFGAIVFGSALRTALGGRVAAGPAPTLVQICGVCAVIAGVLRRDRMAVSPPGMAVAESWHNHGHDLASVVLYVGLTAALLALAARFRKDPDWSALSYSLLAAALVAGLITIVVVVQMVPAWNGILQRAQVTLVLAATVAVALRLLALTGRSGRARAPAA